MAQPSSSQHRSSHHHHRTISSTTLLLVLSLILAVLAVMLALPRSQTPAAPPPQASGNVFSNLFGPKRDQDVVSRENAVAVREAEVAKREADLLSGIPAGVTIGTCLPCSTPAPTAVPDTPVTIIREVEAISPPWWKDTAVRLEELIEREARVSEREKEVGRREEGMGRREMDATRREAWIMEHLMGPPGEGPVVETEEYVYETPGKRTKTVTNTRTVTVPSPANTRLAAQPSPEEFITTRTETAGRTTTLEILIDETPSAEPGVRTVTVVRDRAPRPTGGRAPRRWFGNW